MEDINEFRKYAHELVDWIADYFENIDRYPVKSQVKEREIYNQIPDSAPQEGESMDAILKDFNSVIMPGITHWQNPNFHAYFPANNSYPSILAEMITSAIGAQCMKWETSPAATELEEKVLNWLKEAMELPSNFHGVIQDSASSATLAAILTAREKYSKNEINKKGFSNQNFKVYCSTETHSSVDKAVKIAGIGHENLNKIITDSEGRMIPERLEEAIKRDIQNGDKPLCVVAALGTTGTVAIDPVEAIGKICQEYDIWLHVDAAYAGSALILPELRYLNRGIDLADSFVFNPHKWLLTNFDCSVYFIKDKFALLNTFQINPVYLQGDFDDKVNNYCDWGVQLGRRFRSLKLWFVIRSYGINGLRAKLREHLRLAELAEKFIEDSSDFELVVPRSLNVLSFRYFSMVLSKDELDAFNAKLLVAINKTGDIYLTHSKINGVYFLRIVIAQTNVNEDHIIKAWKVIEKCKNDLLN